MKNESLGRRLTRLRTATGMTRYALAKKAGMSRAYLSRIEAGKADPTVTMARRLAVALGVSLMRLLGESKSGRS